MNMIEETIKRLRTESPAYFRKLRNFCLWYIGAAGAAMATITMLELVVPDMIMTFIKYSIVAATFMGFSSSLPNKDSDTGVPKMRNPPSPPDPKP